MLRLWDNHQDRDVSLFTPFAPARSADSSALRSQVDVVSLDLRIERRGIHAQQAGGARLMPASLIQRSPNQIDLKPPNIEIKIHASPDVLYSSRTRAVVRSRGNTLGGR